MTPFLTAAIAEMLPEAESERSCAARGFDRAIDDRAAEALRPVASEALVDALVDAPGRLEPGAGFEHPERGHATVADAARWLAHEIVHHDLDVRLSVAPAGPAGAVG